MSSDLNYWYLRNHNLFEQLNDIEINELCIISSFKKAKKGEFVYFSDQDIQRLYILKKGRIKIAYYNSEELEVISEILVEGDIFGQTSLKDHPNSNKESAQVLSDDVFVCSFTIEDFLKVLHKKPDLAIGYAQKVGDKLHVLENKYSDLIFKDVRTRVIDFFKLNAKYEGKWEGDKVEIGMFLTQNDIANFTASSRQTVSTIINDLIREGKIIYQSRKKVIIPDIRNL